MRPWLVAAILLSCAVQLRCFRAPDDRALGADDTGPANGGANDAGAIADAGVDVSMPTSMEAGPAVAPCPSASDPGCGEAAVKPADAPTLGADARADGGNESGARDAAVGEACALNACGGCSPLSASPGAPCGQCGIYVCAGEGESVVCQDPAYQSVKAIAAGYNHTCALTTNGGVRCWGFAMYGQLGDGTTTDRPAPAKTDVLTGVQAIASGGQHVCALMTTGAVKCWGDNESGQLGDGSTANRSTPVDVVTPSGPLTGVRTISAGYQHTCALMMSGGLRCWGRNVEGQLGDGTTLARSSPPGADQVAGIQTIAPGLYHTCGIGAAGVLCWGRNLESEVGDGTMINRSMPTNVLTSTGALGSGQAVAAGGYHACAVMPATSGVRCWGANAGGQLGDGTTVDRSTAAASDGLLGVQALALGGYHTCALTAAGGVRCWGYNAQGELGDGTTSNRSTAPIVDVLTGVTAIAVGNSHSCALTASGVRCWGLNMYGQLGDGTTTDRSTPSAELAICP